MILKGNQRSGGIDLATHLLNSFDNEIVEVDHIRGTVAGDLLGAFSEFEATASGTNCKQPFYSLSINPPTPLTREQYQTAIDRIEDVLGLSGQPRAVVFHCKHGREHCHIVWSRIDFRQMKAVHLSHDRLKLKSVARELSEMFGLQMTKSNENRIDTSLAENAQTAKTAITPNERRFDITEAYIASDNGNAFKNALLELGYTLAQGDKRSFVVVDRYGHIHSLTRQIKNVRTKQIIEKLLPLCVETLPSVSEVRAALAPESDYETAKRSEKLIRKLRQHQAKRKAALHRDVRALEKMQGEELRAMQEVHRLELEPSFVRLIFAFHHRCLRYRGLGSLIGYLHHIAYHGRIKRHARELEALKRQQNRHWLELKRRERLLGLLHKKENLSLQTMLYRKTRLSVRRIENIRINAQTITKPSLLHQLPESEKVDPEILALEREYMQPRERLSELFNIASMITNDKNGSAGNGDGNRNYDQNDDSVPTKT